MSERERRKQKRYRHRKGLRDLYKALKRERKREVKQTTFED